MLREPGRECGRVAVRSRLICSEAAIRCGSRSSWIDSNEWPVEVVDTLIAATTVEPSAMGVQRER
jgi:hypothetical protein